MLEPIVLTGHVVRLDPLSLEDVGALAAAAAGDRSSYRYTWVPDGVEDARRYVDAALADQAAGRTLPFTLRRQDTGTVIGSTRWLDLDVFTWPPPWPPGSASGPEPSAEQPPTVGEIGSTWLSASSQRTAVNTEAKLLLLRQAFEVWGMLRVTLKTDARNLASRRAIERIGAKPEGIRRAHVPASDGTVRDTAYYSIVESEWPAIAAGLRRRLGVNERG